MTHKSPWLTAFGILIAIGAAGEIAIAIDPDLVPSSVDELPFIAAHGSSLALRAWIFSSNVVNLLCALTIVRGHDRTHVRLAAQVLRAIAGLGVIVCVPLLLPLTAAGEAMLASVTLAALAVAGAGSLVIRAVQPAARSIST
jgi:hypothetical protein